MQFELYAFTISEIKKHKKQQEKHQNFGLLKYFVYFCTKICVKI